VKGLVLTRKSLGDGGAELPVNIFIIRGMLASESRMECFCRSTILVTVDIIISSRGNSYLLGLPLLTFEKRAVKMPQVGEMFFVGRLYGDSTRRRPHGGKLDRACSGTGTGTPCWKVLGSRARSRKFRHGRSRRRGCVRCEIDLLRAAKLEVIEGGGGAFA
jgi:hypothetical protein